MLLFPDLRPLGNCEDEKVRKSSDPEKSTPNFRLSTESGKKVSLLLPKKSPVYTIITIYLKKKLINEYKKNKFTIIHYYTVTLS